MVGEYNQRAERLIKAVAVTVGNSRKEIPSPRDSTP